ncbi:hypothetical protein N0V90_000134 [Kalmusia sp. IMI 367209]|nr:hypothetical protein N0V90_000134 [Kalmusia sp. IMI 367209]
MHLLRFLGLASSYGIVCAIHVILWDSIGCHGFNDLRSLIAIEDYGCHRRGDVIVELELNGRGGHEEKAVSASSKNPNEASEMVVFFSSDDCDPDNLIEDAYLDEQCSSDLDNWDKVKDYKSWTVWDMCEGNENIHDENFIHSPSVIKENNLQDVLNTIFITLCTVVATYAHHAFASIEEISGPKLSPDNFTAFKGVELQYVNRIEDEDVVYLRRRGDDEFNDESDCMTYSGWTSDEKFPCTPSEDDDDDDDEGEEGEGDDEDESEAVKRSLLKRGTKGATICQGIEVDGVPQTYIKLSSPRWPKLKDLEKAYEMVYDIGGPSDPSKSEWYELKRHEKRWTVDLEPNKGDRCYDSEHVLEWDLISIFLEADEDRSDEQDSRCVLLYKYFKGENMPLDNIKVKKAKDYKKVLGKGDRFDYEDADYEVRKFQSKFPDEINKPRPLDWIGMQWPGKKSSRSRPPTPWEYELVILNKEFNIKKTDIWTANSRAPEPAFEEDGKTLKKIQANSETIEALFDNRYYKDGAAHEWPDNRGKCKAIYRFVTLMSLVSYHNDPYIQELMRAQVERVGAAFEYLETEVLPKLPPWKDKNQAVHTYKAVGLKDAWIEWIKDVHKKRLERLNKFLEDKVSIFKGESSAVMKVKRWDFAGVFGKRLGGILRSQEQSKSRSAALRKTTKRLQRE